MTTHLAAPPERVWAEMQHPRLLEHVAAPLVRFQPLDPPALPSSWEDRSYEVRLRMFGWLPGGRQFIRITRSLDGSTRVFRDDGSGQVAKRWDHTMRVEPGPNGGTRYTDEVEVRAGVLTPFVWAFAQLFYRHRQRRWRALVATDFRDLK